MSLQRRRHGATQGHAPVSSDIIGPSGNCPQMVQSPLTTSQPAQSGALDIATEESAGLGELGDGVAWAEPVDDQFVAEDFVDASVLDRAQRHVMLTLRLAERIQPMILGASLYGLDELLLYSHVSGAVAVADALKDRLRDLDEEAFSIVDGGDELEAVAAANDIKDMVACLDEAMPILHDIQASLNREDLAEFASYVESLASEVWDSVAAVWSDGRTGFAAMEVLGREFVLHRELFEAHLTDMKVDALGLFISRHGAVASFFKSASGLIQLREAVDTGNPFALVGAATSMVTTQVSDTLKSFSVESFVEFGGGLSVLVKSWQFANHQLNASAQLVMMDNIVEKLESVAEVLGPAMTILQQSEEAMMRSLAALVPMLSLADRLGAAIGRVEALGTSSLDRYDNALGGV